MKYLGWKEYSNTGRAYRSWELDDEDREELGEPKAISLHDRGPGLGEGRFQVKVKDGDILSTPTEAELASLFAGAVPRWRPPRKDVDAMNTSLQAIVRSIDSLASAVRVNGLAKAPATTEKAPAKETTAERPANAFLRLVADAAYSNGERYRDWEFLVDCPEIPAKEPKAHPPFAIKGDIIREEPDDVLTPFELKRNGREIGSPEWWQVRPIFDGIDSWHTDVGEVEDDEAPEPQEPEPRERPPFPGWGTAFHGTIVAAPCDFPEAGIKAGDLLWKGHGQPTCIARQLPREHYPAIAAAVRQEGNLVATTHYTGDNRKALKGFVQGLLMSHKHGQRKRGAKPETAPLHVLVPMHETPEPIEATSDDAAIFELLCEAGCRMPQS